MSKLITSLSLDLDNKWSYLRTHGHASWQSYPSYLDVVVPRVLALFERHDLRATVFIVGKDAAVDDNLASLQAIADAGHEIANHSFHHEPWLQRYSEAELIEELAFAEDAIKRATGQRTIGFRGPGFSLSDQTLEILAGRGYQYDATSFPTFLGPIAKLYCLLKSQRMNDEQKRDRGQLFGSLRNGFRTQRPHVANTAAGPIVEIPVTTMPLLRLPIHMTYLHYLAQFSVGLAKAYFHVALRLCRLTSLPPSMLLHPLDFLGAEDVPELAFFPGMKLPQQRKLDLVDYVVGTIAARYQVVTLGEQARQVRERAGLPPVALKQVSTAQRTSPVAT
jgi:peptidoglycan/xylan/chitin deacetylase (PgdA/CDA1 family)